MAANVGRGTFYSRKPLTFFGSAKMLLKYSANQIILQVGFLAISTKILVLQKLFQRGYFLTVPFHYSRKVPDFYLPYLLKKLEKIENGVNQIIMQVEKLIIFL